MFTHIECFYVWFVETCGRGQVYIIWGLYNVWEGAVLSVLLLM